MRLNKSFNHGSLFSGIGGFDLASSWMGWDNLFHCEINEFGRKILNHYWPESTSYNDIKKTDFTIHRGSIDILTGGFPCQPYSVAGKRLGKEDERHLWPEMLRAIREIQPSYIVGENVRGLLNWNGGVVFDEVQADLENEGYEVLPFLLPACGVNAPHKRDRVWFVAHSNHHNDRRTTGENEGESREERLQQRDEVRESVEPSEVFGNAANNKRIGSPRKEHRKKKPRQYPETNTRGGWENFPNESPIYSGDDGLPNQLDGITFSKWRNESIKAYGNAIVPEVAYQIFKAIEKTESSLNNGQVDLEDMIKEIETE